MTLTRSVPCRSALDAQRSRDNVLTALLVIVTVFDAVAIETLDVPHAGRIAAGKGAP